MNDIAALDLQWSKPKRVDTKHGPRMLSTAEPTEKFWQQWRADARALKAMGVSVGKHYQTEQWQVCLWADIPKEQLEKWKANVEASQAVDYTGEIPVPEGLRYYGFQKAGIAFALKCFGFDFSKNNQMQNTRPQENRSINQARMENRPAATQKGGSNPSRVDLGGVLIGDEMG